MLVFQNPPDILRLSVMVGMNHPVKYLESQGKKCHFLFFCAQTRYPNPYLPKYGGITDPSQDLPN